MTSYNVEKEHLHLPHVVLLLHAGVLLLVVPRAALLLRNLRLGRLALLVYLQRDT